ncbi:MAG: DNA polymerase III subunit beta [Phycisphaerales bacterium]|nr:DNA polymerase III subunit beta [Phycisphaerales bacterium]
MKVICNRGALLNALAVMGNAVSTRTPKPALLCVKLSAQNDQLTVTATDLELALEIFDNQVEINQPGECLLPVDKFYSIVRESIDDTISIEIENTTAHIKGRDSHFKVFTQPVDEFPPIPEFTDKADLQIQGGVLKRLINQTLFAAAKESSRYAFNGVLVSAAGKKVTLVSTDGRRLALAKGDLVTASDKKVGSAIIPCKALQLVDKLIDNDQLEEVVSIQIRENRVNFKVGNATLTSSLIEGQFPPYEDVIPKDADKKMSANTAEFLSAIKRAALLSTEESKGVRMQFSKNGLILTSRSPEAGEATINFPCKFEGDDVEIGFNPAFLVDTLKVVNSDEISLELSAANRPGLVKSGSDFLYVIMPVNL